MGRDSRSSCYISKSAHLKEAVTLEDFDLERIVGKGTSGKVYLVEKRDTGAKYAMKSIKKDVVIDND